MSSMHVAYMAKDGRGFKSFGAQKDVQEDTTKLGGYY